jgi:Na+/melibiose symporter-like transporter
MGKRREGTFVGVRDFFGRLSFLAQAGIFAFIHIITGFNSAATVQTPLAIFGIQAHLALVPMILTAIITIMIWKLYDITPEKSEEINKKIMSLKL